LYLVVFPLIIALLATAQVPADSGFLTVKANLPGLAVYLDGDYFGRTPIETCRVQTGNHTLGIVSDDSLQNVYWRLRTGDVGSKLSSLWTLAAINAGTVSVQVEASKVTEVMIDYGRVLDAPTEAKLVACGGVGGLLLVGAVAGFLLHLIAFK
jgi:hypothetical protein